MQSSTRLSIDDLVKRALAMRGADDPEGAVDHLTAAQSHFRREPHYWQSLGLAHRACDQSAEALTALRRAAKLAPVDARIAHALAHVSLEAGLAAAALFDRALALAPNDPAMMIGRSAAQLAEQQGEAAIADLADACRASPLWLEGHAALADLRWLLGDTGGFVASYVAALRDHQHHPALWAALLDRYIRVERYDWAAQGLAAARRIMGPTPDFDAVAAICASENGDATEADRLYAALGDVGGPTMAARFMRHQLRLLRPELAAARGETYRTHRDAAQIWPYLATAWRMTNDPRWQWLEGDARLVAQIKVVSPGSLGPLAHCLRQIHQNLQAPAGQSVRNGTQTDGPLFARIEPEIRKLRAAIVTAISRHVETLPPPDADHPTLAARPERVRFAGSWSVRLTGAGHHSNHVHPQGWLSSAFYVCVPPPGEAGGDGAGHLHLGVPPAELGLSLPPVRVIAAEPGTLVLFPSTMWHGTSPIAGGERMTVAFDVRPRPN